MCRVSAVSLVSPFRQVRLLPSVASHKQAMNLAYLMELKTENLLLPFYVEAGLIWSINTKTPDIHWGWDGPMSHIRGTFTGHWLSAAARLYDQTGDQQLKAKADYIVAEIGRCQDQNGGGWAFPIPEKYLFALKNGKHFWAPQYVCHKIMMGLLDMADFAGNQQALDILDGCAGWFMSFTDEISREQMNDMMDAEETGGMMEFWADLYARTGKAMHRELMERYERPRLTGPLLEGRDVLTNMHANSTIPEIHGCARAYEVTGDERYRRIVEAYWDQAVTSRGSFATGGQTSGEVWTPKDKLSARLGKMNQEHCTVYNMIRLADYLYRWTGDPVYADYIELNTVNGLYAQGYWQGSQIDQCGEGAGNHQTGGTEACGCKSDPSQGLIAYYLPLAAGSKKHWGSKTEDFWCCHCTLVQANSRYREYVFYQDPGALPAARPATDQPEARLVTDQPEEMPRLTIAQYLPARLNTSFSQIPIAIEWSEADLGGSCNIINDVSSTFQERPDFIRYQMSIKAEKPVRFTLRFRLPWWLKEAARIETVDAQGVSRPLPYQIDQGYAVLNETWQDATLMVTLPRQVVCRPLPDEPGTVAFLDGPVLLAGLVDCERTLIGDPDDPLTLIRPHDERSWSIWNRTWRTVNQDFGFYLKPLHDIGYERYTVYFPIRKAAR